jgi:hypothetical protein
MAEPGGRRARGEIPASLGFIARRNVSGARDRAELAHGKPAHAAMRASSRPTAGSTGSPNGQPYLETGDGFFVWASTVSGKCPNLVGGTFSIDP